MLSLELLLIQFWRFGVGAEHLNFLLLCRRIQILLHGGPFLLPLVAFSATAVCIKCARSDVKLEVVLLLF